MGDISMRGKGRALKMKKGGALPSTKGSSKAGMQSKQGRNFLLPKEDKPRRGRDPEKFRPMPMPKPKPPKFGPRPKPMPMPKPKPDRKPRPKPMPMPFPMPPSIKLKEKIEELMEKYGKKARPAMKKDGGTMKSMADLFGKGATAGLGGLPASALKKAFEKAKKLKPSGRINVDDLKRAIDSMKKAKKIDMSPGRRKAETGSTTGKTRGEKLAQSIKDRPMRQKLRRKTRKII